MQILSTVEEMLVTAFKNGMSFKQVHDRIPALAARKLNITVEEFHAEMERLEQSVGFEGLVRRIVSQFTPEEQQAIARRK